MNMGYGFQIFVLFILLALSSFFSAAETALTSLGKLRVRYLMEEETPNAQLLSSVLEHPNKLLSTILVGNNIVNIAASSIATSIAIQSFEALTGNKGSGVGISTLVMTVLILIFGEITPKSLAARNAERYSLLLIRPIYVVMVALSPIVKLFTLITNGIIRQLGGKQVIPKPYITEDELRTIVNVSQEEGVLEQREREMIHSIFEFGDTTISDVMIPRIDISAVSVSITYRDLMDHIALEQFSRIPVYEENIDNIIGILYIRDLLLLRDDDKDHFDMRRVMRKAYYIPESMKAAALFREMQKKRIHMAVVVDEYGGTAGIITMEDLVEEVMGDISDEYDEETLPIQTIDENVTIIDGGLHIEEINEMLHLRLPLSEDWDTIGGLIFSKLGRIPTEGEKLVINDTEIIVLEMTKHRIERVKVVKL